MLAYSCIPGPSVRLYFSFRLQCLPSIPGNTIHLLRQVELFPCLIADDLWGLGASFFWGGKKRTYPGNMLDRRIHRRRPTRSKRSPLPPPIRRADDVERTETGPGGSHRWCWCWPSFFFLPHNNNNNNKKERRERQLFSFTDSCPLSVQRRCPSETKKRKKMKMKNRKRHHHRREREREREERNNKNKHPNTLTPDRTYPTSTHRRQDTIGSSSLAAGMSARQQPPRTRQTSKERGKKNWRGRDWALNLSGFVSLLGLDCRWFATRLDSRLGNPTP